MTKLALLVVLAVMVGGCGGSSDSNSIEPSETSTHDIATQTTESETAATESADPLGCLESASLSNVEMRDADFWRGYHDGPFYQVSIQRLASPPEARQLVTDATDVFSEQAGVYVVTGPARPEAGGQVTADEASEADQLLQEVASCLGG
jgi:hypothetical protein